MHTGRPPSSRQERSFSLLLGLELEVEALGETVQLDLTGGEEPATWHKAKQVFGETKIKMKYDSSKLVLRATTSCWVKRFIEPALLGV